MSLSTRSYLPPSAPQPNTPTGAPARLGPIAGLRNWIVLTLLGRPWLALWFGLHPAARAPLAWAYYEEIAAAPPAQRWRRGLSFFAGLPGAAAAQAEAETHDATRTGGDPPELPPTRSAAAGFSDALRLLTQLIPGAFFALVAVVAWLAVFGEMADIADRSRATSGGEIAALGLVLAVASAPVVPFLYRRRFTWRRARDAGESLPVTLGWVIVTIVFALIAFVGWFGITIENLDLIDRRNLHAFDHSLGLTMIALTSWLPLALLGRRRHWLGRDRGDGAEHT